MGPLRSRTLTRPCGARPTVRSATLRATAQVAPWTVRLEAVRDSVKPLVHDVGPAPAAPLGPTPNAQNAPTTATTPISLIPVSVAHDAREPPSRPVRIARPGP